MSAGNCIEFCMLSECLKEVRGVRALAKGDFLPEGTPTAKFNQTGYRAGPAIRTARLYRLMIGSKDPLQVEMNEDVAGLGGYGRTLTVLFSDNEIEDDECDES